MSNDNFMNKFFEAWQRCPNCEQRYQHQLALDLADSLVSFVKGKISELIGPGDYLLVADTLQVKMDAIKANIRGPNELDFIAQAIGTGNELVTLLEDMEIKLGQSTSTQKQLARAYGQLSTLHLLDLSNEGKNKAIFCCEKSRDICKSTGNTKGAKAMEDMIKYMTNNSFAQEKGLGLDDQLHTMRQLLNERVKTNGAENGEVISIAATLAGALSVDDDGRGRIEAERLLTKYLPISLRVHGEEHAQTKEMTIDLAKCQTRLVALENGEEFQALRYEGGGDKCVVKGPVRKDYHIRPVVEVEGATEYTVDSSSLLFAEGTPIICHGLKKAAHLNGKLAEVRSFDKDKERYTIHFEDTSLKPVAVKKENVRIAFDLPDAE